MLCGFALGLMSSLHANKEKQWEGVTGEHVGLVSIYFAVVYCSSECIIPV